VFSRWWFKAEDFDALYGGHSGPFPDIIPERAWLGYIHVPQH
jgi:hypothetical protein